MPDEPAELKNDKLVIPPHVVLLWEERGGPVVKYPDPVLKQPAKPIGRPSRETRELVDRMKAAMSRDHGVGLAAPQLGVSERVIIYKLPEEKEPLRVILNPKIVTRKGEQTGPEGCLSMPYLQGEVKRDFEIVVKGIDMLGRPWKRRATEFEARVIQHEIDHLDGVLFIERAEPDSLKWLTPGDPEDEDDEDETAIEE